MVADLLTAIQSYFTQNSGWGLTTLSPSLLLGTASYPYVHYVVVNGATQHTFTTTLIPVVIQFEIYSTSGAAQAAVLADLWRSMFDQHLLHMTNGQNFQTKETNVIGPTPVGMASQYLAPDGKPVWMTISEYEFFIAK